MRTDLVVHAPNAGNLARAALPWLAGAIFGDNAVILIAAVRARGLQTISRLAILDAYGPNPGSPLFDVGLGFALRQALAPFSVVTIAVLSPNKVPAADFGFAGSGAPSIIGQGRIASAGFGGFNYGGTAGTRDVVMPPYASALRQALGINPSFRRVASIDPLNWV